MNASQGSWECRHGVDGREWCEQCHAPVTVRPEPNVDAFVERIKREVIDVMSWQGYHAAVADLAALARANTAQALLLHDAMDAHAQVETLVEALLYYASPESWRTLETMGTHSANLDRGKVAREALAPFVSEGETA